MSNPRSLGSALLLATFAVGVAAALPAGCAIAMTYRDGDRPISMDAWPVIFANDTDEELKITPFTRRGPDRVTPLVMHGRNRARRSLSSGASTKLWLETGDFPFDGLLVESPRLGPRVYRAPRPEQGFNPVHREMLAGEVAEVERRPRPGSAEAQTQGRPVFSLRALDQLPTPTEAELALLDFRQSEEDLRIVSRVYRFLGFPAWFVTVLVIISGRRSSERRVPPSSR